MTSLLTHAYNNYDYEQTLEMVVDYMRYAKRERKTDQLSYKDLYKHILSELEVQLDAIAKYRVKVYKNADYNKSIEQLEQELKETLKESHL